MGADLPPDLDRRFEALVLGWDVRSGSLHRPNAGRLRRAVEKLCSLGMELFVLSGSSMKAVDDELGARPGGPGHLYLCLNAASEVFLVGRSEPRLIFKGSGTQRGPAVDGIEEDELFQAPSREARVLDDAHHAGVAQLQAWDSGRWILRHLWSIGIGPSQMAILGKQVGSWVGPDPKEGTPPSVLAVGGGLAAALRILEDQIMRRAALDVPSVDEDPLWNVVVTGLDPELERSRERLLALSDGRIGTTGCLPAPHPAADPQVLAAGVYDEREGHAGLVPGPLWQVLPMEPSTGQDSRRILDLRTGVLAGRWDGNTFLRFSSLARPGTVAIRAALTGQRRTGQEDAALTMTAGAAAEVGDVNGHPWVRTRGNPGSVAAVVGQRRRDDASGRWRLERLGAYQADSQSPHSLRHAVAALESAQAQGFDGLLAEHRAEWASRWNDADVRIDGDSDLQLAVRFALYHLMGSAATSGEAAIGARGMSGPGYRGHVFWDSEVFVLPFLAATCPRSARAILEYRVRRLPAARAAATALGRKGARFPWESAATGRDVTPHSARDRTGRMVSIRTGQLEEHIVADVAWGAWQYWLWTGDEDFLRQAGYELLADTARYWASRVRRDGEGRAHIDDVIGPDEYHEAVNDNAFTNVMARWNLRTASTALSARPDLADDTERAKWDDVADALVDNYDSGTGLYEQFDGFFDLEPLIIRDVAPRRPIVADLLLGAERVRRAQVLKQADVLMLHFMVPSEVAAGSLVSNLQYYEPRTAHGSSLSPGVHAALFARAGRLGDAVEWLRLASRIDLDDVTGTTAGGLHLATMGGVWQAVALGFLGIRAEDRGLRIDPHLPSGWPRVEIRLSFRGSRIVVRTDQSTVSVTCDRALDLAIREGSPITRVDPPGIEVRL